MSHLNQGCADASPSSDPAPSTGRGANERGRRRREQLLQAVADHILEEGVVDFSLRRAAAAAGTTHRMLRYHFGSTSELIREALSVLRMRRVERTVTADPASRASTDLRETWQALMRDEATARVLLQGIGLALAEPERYGPIGSDSVQEYLPPIEASLPPQWSPTRRNRAATLILAVVRGLMLDGFATSDRTRVDDALGLFEALIVDAEWLERR